MCHIYSKFKDDKPLKDKIYFILYEKDTILIYKTITFVGLILNNV